MDIWSYIYPILSSSIVVAIYNQWVNNQRYKKETLSRKKSLLDALIIELSYAQWTINYNYKRIERDKLFHNNALALIKTRNIEEVLLVNPQTLPLSEINLQQLQNYLQEITYLNSQIQEYRAIISSDQTTDRRSQIKYTLDEIKATCTPEEITTGSQTESVSKLIKDILEGLGKLKIK